MDSEEKLAEYVLAQDGIIFRGDAEYPVPLAWDFGQVPTNKHPVTHVHLLDVLDTLSSCSSLKQVIPAQKTAETRMTLKHMKQKYLVRNISHLCESHKKPDENTSKSVSFQYHYSTIIEFSHILHEFYLYIFCLDFNYVLICDSVLYFLFSSFFLLMRLFAYILI